MANNQILNIFKWAGIAVFVGFALNIGFAIIFWNDNDLFMLHWLGVPASMIIMAYGFYRSFK